MLITSGGDGTVHGILSILGEDKRFASTMPLLALFPHGTTNVTAKDIGLQSPHPRLLKHIARLERTNGLQSYILTRHSLRVENLANRPPQHGFIFAAGAPSQATKKVQLESNAKGWTGNAAVGKMLLGDIARKISGRDPSLGGMLIPQDMQMKTRSGQSFNGKTLAIVATTLNTLVLGAKPFWNQGIEPIHVTRIGNFKDQFLISLYRIFYGNKNKLPKDIYQSFSGEGFELKLDSDIVIDGEFYPACKSTPLEITTGPKFRFLRL
jgi:hypothetical protein